MKVEKKRSYFPTWWGLDPKVVVLVDDVNDWDIRKNQHISGDYGLVLEAILHNMGWNRHNLIIESLTGCEEHYNTAQGQELWETDRKKMVWDTLRAAKLKGVSVVIALGDAPLHAMKIKGSCHKNRGSSYELSLNWEGMVTDNEYEPVDMVLVSTFDIPFLKKTRFWKSNVGVKGGASNILLAQQDFEKAKSYATDKPYVRPIEKFILEPTLTDVVTWIDEAIRNQSILGLDIETTALEPWEGDIVVIGLAKNHEEALSIPFYKVSIRHCGDAELRSTVPYWSTTEQSVIDTKLNELFQSNKFYLQNAAFDFNWLMWHGYKVKWSNIAHDSMVLHHVIDPELPHNLGFITSCFGATPYWKEDFKERKGTIFDMDQIEMRKYNLRDCVVLHQIIPPMVEILEKYEQPTRDLYYQERLPLIEAVVEMHNNGVMVSKPKLRAWKKEVNEKLEEIEKQVYDLANLPPSFSLGSGDHLRWLLYSIRPKAFDKLKDFSKKKVGTKVYEELLGIKQLSEVVPFVEHSYKGIKAEKSGKITVDAQGRIGLLNHLNNRLVTLTKLRETPAHLEEKVKIEKMIEWLGLFSEYQKIKKIASTYTEFPIAKHDGKVHSSFSTIGTSTSRLASRNPNLQNIPKKGFGAKTRSVFVASPGNIFVSFDYDNLEFGTMAYETGEPNFVKIFEEGLNVHDINTREYFGIDPTSPDWKPVREAAKIFQFGGVQYGGSDRQILSQILLKVPGVKFTLADYKRAKDNYLIGNPRFAEWRAEKEMDAKNRQVVNAFGHVRNLYGNESDLVKICYNTPCQSAAAHIINMATIAALKAVREHRHPGKLVLQIHDQLVFETPIDYVVSLIRLIHPIMTAPLQFRDRMVQFRTSPEVSIDLYRFNEVDMMLSDNELDAKIREIKLDQEHADHNEKHQNQQKDEDYYEEDVEEEDDILD